MINRNAIISGAVTAIITAVSTMIARFTTPDPNVQLAVVSAGMCIISILSCYEREVEKEETTNTTNTVKAELSTLSTDRKACQSVCIGIRWK